MDTTRKIQHLALMSHEENIKKFLFDKKEELGGSMAFSEYLKKAVSDRTIDSWLKGDRHPGRKNLQTLAEAFNLDVKDILNYGEDKDNVPDLSDYVAIPYIYQEAQGGPSGRLGQPREVRSYLAFSYQWAFSKGNPSKMEVLKVRGDSMAPTINDGDIVLIDKSQRDGINGYVYVVVHNDELKVKRLWVEDEPDEKYATYLRSDNTRRYQPERVSPADQFKIIGRVIWRASEVF